MICPHCKKELEEGSLFCSYCGEKMEQKKQAFCTQCGAKLDKSAAFCSKCGAAVNAVTTMRQDASPAGETAETRPQKENPQNSFQWSKVTAFLKRCGEICFALLCLLGVFIKEKAVPFVKKNAKVCAAVASGLVVVIIVATCVHKGNDVKDHASLSDHTEQNTQIQDDSSMFSDADTKVELRNDFAPFQMKFDDYLRCVNDGASKAFKTTFHYKPNCFENFSEIFSEDFVFYDSPNDDFTGYEYLNLDGIDGMLYSQDNFDYAYSLHAYQASELYSSEKTKVIETTIVSGARELYAIKEGDEQFQTDRDLLPQRVSVYVSKETENILAVSMYYEQEVDKAGSWGMDMFFCMLIHPIAVFSQDKPYIINPPDQDELFDAFLQTDSQGEYVTDSGCIVNIAVSPSPLFDYKAITTITLILPDAYCDPVSAEDMKNSAEGNNQSDVQLFADTPKLNADDIVGSWVHWGSLYDLEDERYISSPIPEEKLNIDRRGDRHILVTKQQDNTYLFNTKGRITEDEMQFIYDETNNTYYAKDELEKYGYDKYGYYYYVMVDKDTLHLKYPHHFDYLEDIGVYKRSESGFATEQPYTTDKDDSQLSSYMTIDEFVGAFNKLSGSDLAPKDLLITTTFYIEKAKQKIEDGATVVESLIRDDPWTIDASVHYQLMDELGFDIDDLVECYTMQRNPPNASIGSVPPHGSQAIWIDASGTVKYMTISSSLALWEYGEMKDELNPYLNIINEHSKTLGHPPVVFDDIELDIIKVSDKIEYACDILSSNDDLQVGLLYFSHPPEKWCVFVVKLPDARPEN